MTGDRRMLGRRMGTMGAAFALLLGGMALSPWTGSSGAAGQPYQSSTANGNDDLKTSWYPGQSGLTPALVTGGTFGQLWDGALDDPADGFAGPDQLYGQPLVYANPATGAATVVVATEANALYGFDAATGARRYKVSLGQPFDPATLGCADLLPRIGITSTPAIDAATGTSYVFSKQVVNGVPRYVAYGYSAETGAVAWSTVIAGAAQNSASAVFDATVELQRPGLLINQGVLYAAFGGHCDIGNYRGWIVGIDLQSHQIVTMWADQPGETVGGGIWQGGGGIMSDGPGRLFVATGNSQTGGPYVNTQPVASGTPPTVLGESMVRLEVQPDHTLRPTSFFIPYDAEQLDKNDLDFGSGGPIGVMPEALTPSTRADKVLVAVGKQGYVYLLDRDDLGGYKQGVGGGDQLVSRVGPDGGTWTKPAVWPGEGGDGGYVYNVTSTVGASVVGTAGFLNAYKIVTGPTGRPALQKIASTADSFAFSSGAPIVTSAGTTPGTGIVWTVWSPGTYIAGAELRAYRAVPEGGAMTLLGRWPVGLASKFASPVASGNRVFVGTRDGHLKAFGSPIDTPVVASTPVFPDTVTGQSIVTDVTVTANVAATITAVASGNPAFVVGTPSVALPAVLPAGGTLTVPVTFTPTALGPTAGSLVIQSDVGPATVPMSGRGLAAAGRLTSNPAAVSMGGSPIGGVISSSFTLNNIGASALTVTGVSAPDAPFTATAPPLPFDLAPGATVQVGLTFAPAAAGSFVSDVVVTSTGGDVTVPVTASAAEPGHRTVAPSTLAFAGTLVGGHRTRAFTLGNDGGSPFTVSISKPPIGGQFAGSGSALPEGSSIAPGAQRVLPVRFTPTVTGPLADGWDLSTTEGSGRTSLAVTGTGIASVAVPAPGPAWTTNGDAVVTADGTLELNADAPDRTGAAWFATPVATDHVEAHVTAYLDGPGAGTPGEGLTFALVDANQSTAAALGAGGGGLGLGGLGGALAVAVTSADPSGTGDLVGVVGIAADGTRTWLAPPVTVSPSVHGSAAGQRPVALDVWIDRGAGGPATITALVDSTPVVTDLPVTVPERAFVGFTGATSAQHERHAVSAPTILVGGLAAATCPASFGGWKAEYFANATLAGTPVVCRDDALVSFDWADGAAAPGLPADGFSARWTRTVATGARTYTFTAGSDDGSRLYIDGRLVLNAWRVQTYTPRSARVLLTAGLHTIVYEYFDETGPARVLLGIR